MTISAAAPKTVDPNSQLYKFTYSTFGGIFSGAEPKERIGLCKYAKDVLYAALLKLPISICAFSALGVVAIVVMLLVAGGIASACSLILTGPTIIATKATDALISTETVGTWPRQVVTVTTFILTIVALCYAKQIRRAFKRATWRRMIRVNLRATKRRFCPIIRITPV